MLKPTPSSMNGASRPATMIAPGVGAVDAGQALEQRALARAVAPHDPEELALGDLRRRRRSSACSSSMSMRRKGCRARSLSVCIGCLGTWKVLLDAVDADRGMAARIMSRARIRTGARRRARAASWPRARRCVLLCTPRLPARGDGGPGRPAAIVLHRSTRGSALTRFALGLPGLAEVHGQRRDERLHDARPRRVGANGSRSPKPLGTPRSSRPSLGGDRLHRARARRWPRPPSLLGPGDLAAHRAKPPSTRPASPGTTAAPPRLCGCGRRRSAWRGAYVAGSAPRAGRPADVVEDRRAPAGPPRATLAPIARSSLAARSRSCGRRRRSTASQARHAGERHRASAPRTSVSAVLCAAELPQRRRPGAARRAVTCASWRSAHAARSWVRPPALELRSRRPCGATSPPGSPRVSVADAVSECSARAPSTPEQA